MEQAYGECESSGPRKFSPDGCSHNTCFQLVLNKLNEDRSANQQLCDFTIKTRTQNFPVHKCLLRDISEFFKRMFETNMKEKFENCVKIETIEPEILKAVIEFIYNNSSLIDSDNVNEVLKAADYLQIPSLVTHCTEMMETNLTQQNVIDAWILAKQFNLESLITKSCKLIVSNFETILKQKQCLEINSGYIEDFFRLKDKSTSGETFYQSIVEWVNHESESRKVLFPKLFGLIDLSRISKTYLCENVSINELISKNPDCSMKVIETMSKFIKEQKEEMNQQAQAITKQNEIIFEQKKDMNQQAKTVTKQKKTISKQRKTISKQTITIYQKSKAFIEKEQLVIEQRSLLKQQKDLIEPIAGVLQSQNIDRSSISNSCRLFNQRYEFFVVCDEDDESKIFKYNVATKQEHEIARPHFDTISAGLIYAENQLFAIGGKVNKYSLNSINDMDHLDLITDNEWYENPSMNQKRHSFGCAVYNSNIYVAGGQAHKTEYLSSVECYSLSTDRWIGQPHLNQRRAGCCMIQYNGKLFVLGGYVGNVYHNSVEILCDGRWIMGTPMNHARANLSAVVLDGELYALGGINQGRHLLSVEKYNHDDDCWYLVKPLNRKIYESSACVVDGKIFVVGYPTIETYDQKNNEWNFYGYCFLWSSSSCTTRVVGLHNIIEH